MRDTGAAPGLKRGEPMKRLYAVLSLILLVTVLALPAMARAVDSAPPAAPAGWTWDESGATQSPDGWTWDEA